MIKNCDDAESGTIVLAIDNTPRVCNKSLATPLLLNSPLILSAS